MKWLEQLVFRALVPGVSRSRQDRELQTAALGDVVEFSVSRRGLPIKCASVSRGSSTANTALLSHPVSRQGKRFFLSRGERVIPYLDHGFDVVTFDFNGFAGAPFIDLRFPEDVRAVLDAAVQAGTVRRLVLHGVSFGAFQLIPMLASFPAGAAVVLESPPRSLEDYARGSWFGLRALGIAKALGYKYYEYYNVRRILQTLERSDLRIVFIATDTDSMSPADHVSELARCLSVPHEFHCLRGGHMKAPLADTDKYRSIIHRACQ